jgi:hypothetical protein
VFWNLKKVYLSKMSNWVIYYTISKTGESPYNYNRSRGQAFGLQELHDLNTYTTFFRDDLFLSCPNHETYWNVALEAAYSRMIAIIS